MSDNMSDLYMSEYHWYFSLIVHIFGFLIAVVTGKQLREFRLFPIFKYLLGTLIGTSLFTYGVSVIGSILMIILGQSLTTCTVFIYNMAVAPFTLTVVTACLALDRYWITKKKVPNVRKLLWSNMIVIIPTVVFCHFPILLSILQRPLPIVAECASLKLDLPNCPEKWYGWALGGLISTSWIATCVYSCKLKTLIKSMKTEAEAKENPTLKQNVEMFSRRIPNNVMYICYIYTGSPLLIMTLAVCWPRHKIVFNIFGDLIFAILTPLLLNLGVSDQSKPGSQVYIHKESRGFKAIRRAFVKQLVRDNEETNRAHETVSIIVENQTVTYRKRLETVMEGVESEENAVENDHGSTVESVQQLVEVHAPNVAQNVVEPNGIVVLESVQIVTCQRYDTDDTDTKAIEDRLIIVDNQTVKYSKVTKGVEDNEEGDVAEASSDHEAIVVEDVQQVEEVDNQRVAHNEPEDSFVEEVSSFLTTKLSNAYTMVSKTLDDIKERGASAAEALSVHEGMAVVLESVNTVKNLLNLNKQ